MRLVKDYSRKMKRLRKRVVALANDSDDEIADASETKHEGKFCKLQLLRLLVTSSASAFPAAGHGHREHRASDDADGGGGRTERRCRAGAGRF